MFEASDIFIRTTDLATFCHQFFVACLKTMFNNLFVVNCGDTGASKGRYSPSSKPALRRPVKWSP